MYYMLHVLVFLKKKSEKKVLHTLHMNISNLRIKSEYFQEIRESVSTNCPYTRYNQF